MIVSCSENQMCLPLRYNTVTAAGRFDSGSFCVPALVQNCAHEKKNKINNNTKAFGRAEHQVITQEPGNESLRVQRGQMESRKLNPISPSVASLWLQTWPQIRRTLLFAGALRLVNGVLHHGADVAGRPDRKGRSLLRRVLKWSVSPHF